MTIRICQAAWYDPLDHEGLGDGLQCELEWGHEGLHQATFGFIYDDRPNEIWPDSNNNDDRSKGRNKSGVTET
jgi:hypothetical protein